VLIDTAKLYEVQKYCSLTNHVWSGFHVGFNVARWNKLPPDIQETVHRIFSAESVGGATGLRDDDADRAAESDRQGPRGSMLRTTGCSATALSKSGFYADMKKTMGDEGWTLLEKYTGELVLTSRGAAGRAQRSGLWLARVARRVWLFAPNLQ